MTAASETARLESAVSTEPIAHSASEEVEQA